MTSRLAIYIGALVVLVVPALRPVEAAPVDVDVSRRARTHFSFHDVDVAVLETRLARLGVHLPIGLKGKVTATIGIAIPWRSLLSAGAYEFTGDFTSPQLVVAGVDLHDLAARLHWAEGVLSLDDLRFALEAAAADNDKRGQLVGSARMQVEPRGQFTLAVALDGLTVATLAKQFPLLSILREGRFSGRVEATVPVNDIRSPEAWTADVRLRADDVNVEGVAGLHGDVAVNFRQANARATRLVLEAPFGRIEGTASGGLAAPFPFTMNATATFGDLSKLESIAGVTVPLAGQATATFAAQGNGQPTTAAARGVISLSNVSVKGITIPAASVDIAVDEKTITLSDATAAINGGTISGVATVPVTSGTISGSVGVQNVRLEPFSQVAKLGYSIGGRVSGEARFSLDREHWQDSLRWNVDAQGVGDDLRVAASQSRRFSATLALAEGMLRVPRLQGDLDGGTVDGSANLDLRDGHAFDSQISLVNLDVARLSQLAPTSLSLPAIAGRISSRSNVRGTVEPLHATGSGSFAATGLSANGIMANRVTLQFALGGTHVDIADLDAALLGGRATGTARVAWQEVESTVALDWNNIDLAPIALLKVAMPQDTNVVTTGWVRGGGPPKSADLTAWKARAAAIAVAKQLSQTIATAGASIDLDQGKARLTNTQINIAGGQTTLDGDVTLTSPFAFHAKGQTSKLNLALAKSFAGTSLPVDVQGTVDAQFDATGTLQPLTVTGSANASGQTLRVDQFVIDSWSGILSSDGDAARLEAATINAYDGRITASASLPLAALNSDSDATASVDAGWQNVNLARLPLVPQRWVAGSQADTEGDINLKVPPAKFAQPKAWTWQTSLKTRLAERGGIQLGNVDISGNGADGRAKIEGQGTLLGARLALNASAHANKSFADYGIDDVHFLLDRLQLSQLANVSHNYSLRPLRGTLSASADLHRTSGNNVAEDGTGSLRIESLGWGNAALSDHLAATFRVGHGSIDLVDTNGSLAGGTLHASGQIPFDRSRIGHVSVGLSNVHLQQLLKPWPSMAAKTRGSVDVKLRGRLGEVCRFEGTASARDASVAGMRVSDAQFPFDATFEPRSGRAKLVSTQGHAQLARGRMTSRLEVDVLRDVSLRGNIDLTNVDLNTLEASLSPSARYGSGTIGGTFAFAGKNVRSINDVTGTLRFKLRNTQAMTLPVLQQVGPLLSAGLSTATKFNDGDIQGSLARGVVRLKKFSLSSPSVQVFASGNVALTGRLDLELVARTGQQGANGPLATLALDRLALTAAGPVGWVIEANELLSNRVINAHVSGNFRHPTVQIRPAKLLEQEALRFFLGQAAGSAVP